MFNSNIHFGELFYKMIIQASPTALIVVHREKIVLTNAQANKLFKYDEGELIGKPVEQLVPERFRKHHPGLREEYFQSPRARAMGAGRDLYGIRKDGKEIPVEIGLNPINVDGQTYILTAVIDITERKRAEDRFRMVIEAAPNSMVMINEAGAIVLVNSQAEKLFGYTRAEIIGKPVELLIPSKFKDTHPHLRKSFLSHPKARPMGEGRDLFGLRKDQKEVPVEIGLNPLIRDGETFVLASIIDITERKRTEGELERARDLAIEASRVKSEFLANMSHEIRTPMNAVLGMTGLLLETPLDEEQKMFAKTVLSAGEGLLQIINDILDFSRIEAGRFSVEPIDFNLKTAIKSAAELIGVDAQNKGLSVNFAFARDLPSYVHGDPGRIKQILINLLSNAVKFTEKGEITVSAGIVNDTNNIFTIRIGVTDTGIGIPLEKQSKLFQPFSQVDSASTRKYGGTGLGLAICKKIAEALHGFVTFESYPGQGSTFYVTLPLGYPVERQENVVRSKFTDFGNLRILILTEQKIAAEELIKLFDSWHVQYSMGSNISELVGSVHYDLMIYYCHNSMDPVLPDLEKYASDLESSNSELIIVAPSGFRLSDELKRNRRVSLFNQTLEPSKLLNKIQELKVLKSRGVRGTANLNSPRNESSEGKKYLKVLLVEDNSANQRVSTYQLRKLGCDVDAVANGVEAIQAFRNIHYDLILMDCLMPEMDGYQATQEIRRIEAEMRLPRVPIIAMTANVLEGEREKCLQAGMDDFLGKPVYIEELGHALARVEGAKRPNSEVNL